MKVFEGLSFRNTLKKVSVTGAGSLQEWFSCVTTTPFTLHYQKIRNHLCQTQTNSAKIHSLAQKNKHLHINQIQLPFFLILINIYSLTLLGTHTRHSAYKREKYTFINAKVQVINTILKVNKENRQTLKLHTLMYLHAIERSLQLIYKNRFSIKQ